MDRRTLVGYEQRLDWCLQRLTEYAEQEVELDVEEWQKLFDKMKMLRIKLYDNAGTEEFKRQLVEAEVNVKGFLTPSMDGVVEVADVTFVEGDALTVDTVAGFMIDRLGKAQVLIMEAYQAAVSFNSLTKDIPVIQSLPELSKSLIPSQRGISKLSGLNHPLRREDV